MEIIIPICMMALFCGVASVSRFEVMANHKRINRYHDQLMNSVSKENFDHVCRQRDKCLEGWNKTIADLKTQTTTLDETIVGWAQTTQKLEEAVSASGAAGKGEEK